MFGKKEKCAICGEKLSGTGIQINGGAVCPICNRLSTGSPLCTAEQLKEAWEENHRRFQSFNAGITVSDFGSGFYSLTQNRKCSICPIPKSQNWNQLFSSFLKLMNSELNR